VCIATGALCWQADEQINTTRACLKLNVYIAETDVITDMRMHRRYDRMSYLCPFIAEAGANGLLGNLDRQLIVCDRQPCRPTSHLGCLALVRDHVTHGQEAVNRLTTRAYNSDVIFQLMRLRQKLSMMQGNSHKQKNRT